ncbi:MAG: aspartate aminotransferase family protein [Phycisphaeraceae bacterium]|nr:aspartate aminotransferase family protein [Phycisphaeraceae bacterium]
MTDTQTTTLSADPTLDLAQAARDHLFVGMANPVQLEAEGGPLIIDRAEGIYLYDAGGQRYIDGISGMYFRNVGYGREEIARAIYDQIARVSMNVYAGVTSSTVTLAAKLAQIAPGDLTRTFFCQGGSEANESSIKMARAYHVRRGDRGRFKVISRQGSYHGGTWGTMWLGEHPFFPRTDYQPSPSHCIVVPGPNMYRCAFNSTSPEQCGELSARAIEQEILRQGPDSVSAVIGEPVTQPLGGVVPPPNYWPLVREICDRYGVLLIFDEVITGFGRVGTWFGADLVGVTPDIMSFAKGVTSGYFPLGGSMASAKIAEVFEGGPEKTWSHMYTYSAHPGGAAAALSNLEIVERENLVDNARQRGEQLAGLLQEMKQRHPIIGDVRGTGLIQGIEFVKDRATKEHFDPSQGVNAMLTAELKERGVWLRVPPYILPFAPPLTITADELDELASKVDEALTTVEQRLGMARG